MRVGRREGNHKNVMIKITRIVLMQNGLGHR
jgi:hypothetical protein